MFIKDEFMKYVGSASGSSYSGGLKAIENIYGVDIDAEYEKDKCRMLLRTLEQDKRSGELNKTELKRRSDMTSHLKKYIEFRENSISIEQRKIFVSWMQNQPRRDDPTKKYSIETINGAADKLQSGLKKLGVTKYAEVNCFTITNSEYFAELHKACYISENVTLLYPLTEKVDPNQNIEFLSNDGTVIRIRFLDLFDLSNSLSTIIREIQETE